MKTDDNNQTSLSVANLSKLTRPSAIQKAMREYDQMGRERFLKQYGFGKAYRFRLKAGTKRYDSKAILGVAYGIQYPEEGPLTASDFAGGEATVCRRLTSLGLKSLRWERTAQKRRCATTLLAKWRLPCRARRRKQEQRGQFHPSSIEDARKKIRAAIILRRGQRRFRAALMKAYDALCAISDCNCPEALEAAHIQPYRGDETNYVVNGLLLRADIHTLFDLGLISIDPQRFTVIISKTLQKTVYWAFNGKPLHLPANQNSWPNTEVLKRHRVDAGL